MKLKRAAIILTVLALILVVMGTSAAQLYQQKSFSYSYTETPIRRLQLRSSLATLNAITINEYIMLAVSSATPVQAPENPQSALTNATRSQIFELISANPGLQFRGICSALFLPVGLAEYHLGVLVRSGLVSFVRDGRYKRFFVSNRFSRLEMLAICLLRHKTAKRIIETLMHKKQLSHGRLAMDVSITSQALTWQMKTLRETPFIIQANDGLKIIYQLDESSMPMLRTYLTVVN